MHILMVSPQIGNGFGQERVLRDSSRLLQSAGHQVSFLAETASDQTLKDCASHLVPGLTQLHWLSAPHRVRRLHQQALRFAEKIKPDVVHFIDQFDFRLMQTFTRRFPTLMTSHTVATTCPASDRRIDPMGCCEQKSGWSCVRFHREYQCLSFLKSDWHRRHAIANHLLRRRALRKMKLIGAISQYVKASLLRENWPEEKITLLYNPIQTPKYISRLPLPPQNLLVCASRLVPHKGVDSLIRALKHIEKESWTLWVCGDGPLRQSLRILVHKLGLDGRVYFTGHLSFERTQQAVASATALIQPNIGPEPFGLSVAEAAAMGTPVIAYDVPALNEIILHRHNGLLAPLGQEAALANQIAELLNNKALRTQLSTQGPESIQSRFSPEAHLESTLKAYQWCLKDPEPSSAYSKDPLVHQPGEQFYGAHSR